MRQWIFCAGAVAIFLLCGFCFGWGEAYLSAASVWLGWTVRDVRDKRWKKWEDRQ